MNLEKEIFEISLVDIMPNRFQPREIFDDEALKELSESIKAHGVIQPIIVRKVGDKYEIIAGERRYRASQLAGKQTIPALVRDIDDKEAAKIALLENLQRKDLSPIEEAKTYQTILKLDNITQDELARNLGKSQSAIANKLRLLNLDEEVQTALLNAQISERHARSLLNLDNGKQKELLHKIVNERLTVRQVDEEVMKLTGKMPDLPSEDQSQFQNINMQEPLPKNNAQTMPALNEIKPENNTQEQMINTIPTINDKEEVDKKKETQEEKSETPTQDFTNTIIDEPKEEQTPRPTNIFDRLRIDNNDNKNDQNTSSIPMQNQPNTDYSNIYDLRFAINNFRQAIQNTEKFGFKVKAEEKDTPESYQIIINIDKNN